MLSRPNRLKEKRDFDNIFKNGKKINTPLFLLAYISRADQNPTRIGVVAGKKVGGAVERNRAKRLIREGARILLEKYPKGYDIAFICNSGIIKEDQKIIYLKICNYIISLAL